MTSHSVTFLFLTPNRCFLKSTSSKHVLYIANCKSVQFLQGTAVTAVYDRKYKKTAIFGLKCLLRDQSRVWHIMIQLIQLKQYRWKQLVLHLHTTAPQLTHQNLQRPNCQMLSVLLGNVGRKKVRKNKSLVLPSMYYIKQHFKNHFCIDITPLN